MDKVPFPVIISIDKDGEWYYEPALGVDRGDSTNNNFPGSVCLDLFRNR